MGRITRPEALIRKTVRIPPISTRPSVKSFGHSGANSFGEITTLLQHLVKRNNSLPDEPSYNDESYDVATSLLQHFYTCLIKGQSAAAQSGSKTKRTFMIGRKPIPSYTSRLVGKEGRIRRNLLGKRVWNISRSTISGNTQLKIDEVGISLSVARTLQVEEVVQSYNYERLLAYFLNGNEHYPGCSKIRKGDSGKIKYIGGGRSEDVTLEIGDTIFRDTINGDVCLFNRQPSLDRGSIGMHRAVVLMNREENTNQMNVSACGWYNADFDGDAMNLIVLHSTAARAEAMITSALSNWFISTQSSGPYCGQVQDGIVSSFEMTRDDVVISRNRAMAMFGGIKQLAPQLDITKKTYTGREVYSALLKKTPISYDREPTFYKSSFAEYIEYSPTETRTIIKSGEIIQGVMDKAALGDTSAGSIFHRIERNYGAQVALESIFAVQQMVLNFTGCTGFSFGVYDMHIPKKPYKEALYDQVNAIRQESLEITNQLVAGDLIPPIGMTTREFYERRQKGVLATPDHILWHILGSMDPKFNAFFKLIASGGKGNQANIIHIMGMIGQVNIADMRIEEKLSFRRTSPYFHRFETDPEASGFIPSNYVDGLSCSEFLFSAMNGRYDLINKALSTAMTGAVQRDCVLCLESTSIDNLRACSKHTRVVQLIYGDDGADTRKVDKVDHRTLMISDAELRDRFRVDLSKLTWLKSDTTAAQVLFDTDFDTIVIDREEYRDMRMFAEGINTTRMMNTSFMSPVDVAKTVMDQLGGDRIINEKLTVADLIEMRESVKDLSDTIVYSLVNEGARHAKIVLPEYLHTSVRLFQQLIHIELAIPTLLFMNPMMVSEICDLIRLRYKMSLIDYGTAIGTVTSQCIGQPLTQYMLDSHHRSVQGGTNKSGLKKVKELVYAKKLEAEETSETIIHVKAEYEANKPKVQEIANSIELLLLKYFVDRETILLEGLDAPNVHPIFARDKRWMTEFKDKHPLIEVPNDLTDWCIRLELNKSRLVLKSITLEHIVERLRTLYPFIHIVHTSENAPRLAMRMYLRRYRFSDSIITEAKMRTLLQSILNDKPIRGIRGLLNTTVIPFTRYAKADDGSLKQVQLWAIAVSGSNLSDLSNNRFIDLSATVSSSVDDTYRMFGIEAARQKIINELQSFNQTLNMKHYMMCADEMTWTGEPTPLSRSGLTAREPKNILQQMAFGGAVQVMQHAAINDTVSVIRGPSARLMLGDVPRIGTAYNQLVVNTEFIRKNTKSVNTMIASI
jgi:DNA-directed RNA polymerase beta' subunit